MANCRQACPYNTLDGCKVKEYNAICPLTNMATPITEYKMTNADRIRAMSDEELAKFLYDFFWGRKKQVRLFNLEKWLKQPEEDDHDERKENENA